MQVADHECKKADQKCKSGGWGMQEWFERSASGRLGVHERQIRNARAVDGGGVQERQVRNARAVDGECKSG